jgi:hypothetical protein
MWRMFQNCGPLKVFLSLNIIVRPAHGFELDMPDLEIPPNAEKIRLGQGSQTQVDRRATFQRSNSQFTGKKLLRATYK